MNSLIILVMFFRLFNYFSPIRMLIFYFSFFSFFTVMDVESSAISLLARPCVRLHLSFFSNDRTEMAD